MTVKELADVAAQAQTSDLCELHLACGRLDLTWHRMPRPHHAAMYGELHTDAPGLSAILQFVRTMSVDLEATYSYADLEDILLDDNRKGSCWLEQPGWLWSLYWYNYFGRALRIKLEPIPSAAQDAFDLNFLSNGAFEVVTRPSPETAEDVKVIKRICNEWKVFRKHRWRAGFKGKIEVNLARLVGPDVADKQDVEVGKPYVKSYDDFISGLSEMKGEFLAWVRERDSEASIVTSYDAFLCIWKHADEIDIAPKRITIAAIATYGELLREEIGGVWSTSKWFAPSGEPVVKRRQSSLLCRPVVEEVLGFLDLEPFDQVMQNDAR